jgi:hypothetical protein
LFAAKDVGEDERLSELASSHDEARAVDGPRAFHVHNLSPLGGGLLVDFSFLVSGFWLAMPSSAQNVLRPIAAARGWFSVAK